MLHSVCVLLGNHRTLLFLLHASSHEEPPCIILHHNIFAKYRGTEAWHVGSIASHVHVLVLEGVQSSPARPLLNVFEPARTTTTKAALLLLPSTTTCSTASQQCWNWQQKSAVLHSNKSSTTAVSELLLLLLLSSRAASRWLLCDALATAVGVVSPSLHHLQ